MSTTSLQHSPLLVRLLSGAVLAFLLILLLADPAAANGQEPLRAGDQRQPADALVLGLPVGSWVLGDNLTVEVDGVDVTSVALLRGGRLTVPAVMPWARGDRVVVVYAREAGNGWRPLVTLPFTVAGSSAEPWQWQQAGVSGRTTSVSERASGGSWNSNSEGAWQLSASGSNGRMSVSADSDWLLSTSEHSERRFDVGEFSLGVQSNRLALSLGHQSLGEPSLLLDGARKRGVSVELRSAHSDDARFGLRAFRYGTSYLTGRDNALGTSDPDNRATGIHVSAALTSDPDKARVIAGWQEGSRFGIESEVVSGGVRSRLLDDRFDLRADWAQRQDDADNAEARDGSVTLRSPHGRWNWLIQAGHSRVDDLFISPGNASLAPDRRQQFARVQGSAGNWSADLSSNRDADNVRGQLAVTNVRRDDRAQLEWGRGSHRLSIAGTSSRARQQGLPDVLIGFVQPAAKGKRWSGELRGSHQLGTASTWWALRQERETRRGLFADELTLRSADMGLSLALGQQGSLSVNGGWNDSDSLAGGTSRFRRAGLDAQWSGFDNQTRLSAQLQVSDSDESAGLFGADRRQQYASFRLDQVLLKPRRLRPGLRLAAGVTWTDQQGLIDDSTTQVFVRLEATHDLSLLGNRSASQQSGGQR